MDEDDCELIKKASVIVSLTYASNLYAIHRCSNATMLEYLNPYIYTSCYHLPH